MCLQLGIDDPEQWLENVPKRVLDFWDAYYKIEPFGIESHQAATICQMLDWIYTAVLAKNGVQRDPLSYHDYMPVGTYRPEQAKQTNLVSKLERLSKLA